MMPQIAAIIIPANAETIIARVPITLPAQNIRSVSPSSMPRISSPLRFFITALLISPIIKNGTLMHKAPIILSVILSESVKICEGIERRNISTNILISISRVSQSMKPTTISNANNTQVIMDSAFKSIT